VPIFLQKTENPKSLRTALTSVSTTDDVALLPCRVIQRVPHGKPGIKSSQFISKIKWNM
jgi:hypothetical protein